MSFKKDTRWYCWYSNVCWCKFSWVENFLGNGLLSLIYWRIKKYILHNRLFQRKYYILKFNFTYKTKLIKDTCLIILYARSVFRLQKTNQWRSNQKTIKGLVKKEIPGHWFENFANKAKAIYSRISFSKSKFCKLLIYKFDHLNTLSCQHRINDYWAGDTNAHI